MTLRCSVLRSGCAGDPLLTPARARRGDWLRARARPSGLPGVAAAAGPRWFGDLMDRVWAGGGPAAASRRWSWPAPAGAAGRAWVAFLLSRLGANPPPRAPAPRCSPGPRSRRRPPRRARAALGAGRWDDAVLEAVRALAAGLVERGLTPERRASRSRDHRRRRRHAVPRRAGAGSEQVAAAFDETRYGDRPADEAQARAAVELERDLARAAPGGPGATGPVGAVPR